MIRSDLRQPRKALLLFAAIVFLLVVGGYEIGKDLAERDDARAAAAP
jgi:hypothetical protein